MGIANDYYRILEEESQGFYQDTNEAKRKSLQSKYLSGTTKILSNIGVNPVIAALGTSIGSLIGGKYAAENHFFEKILKDHQNIGSFLDAAALSPYLLMRMSNQANNLKAHKQEQNYFVKGNNWQDYGVGAQSAHAMRTISKLSNTASLLGIGAGILTGQPGIAAAASNLSPYLLSYKLGTGLSHLAGSGISAATSLFGGSIAQAGDLLGNILGGPVGGMITSAMLTKFMQNLTPKAARTIISITPLNEPGLPQLMMTSTYKTYSNTIRMLQGQGLLKPSESLMLSILNDINLNTHALVPIYGKFLGNSKEVAQQHHINTWSALFNDDPENYTKFKAAKFGLTEGDFSIRKAMFKTLTSAELWAENLLYKLPGARYLTGMTKEEFEEKRKDLLFGNDNRARAEETTSLKTGVSLSTIRLLNTKADKWLNAPDYESRMLGLTAGIYELVRFIAQHTGKSQEALEIYNKTLNHLNYRDMLNYRFMNEDQNKRWYRNIPILSGAMHIINKLNPVTLAKDLIGTPLKAIKNLKSHFKKNLGIADLDKIYSTYENNKNMLKNKFDIKKSAEMYLGKYLPDHMTQIIHYLKTISVNIKDMLKCWNCNITNIEKSSSKWRGRYGDYMDEETFDKRIKADAYHLTRNQLGIRVRNMPKGLSKIAAKIMGINKETLNEDNDTLKAIFKEDFFKSKKAKTADDEQQKLKEEKEAKETTQAIKKTPQILEKMFNWFKKHGLEDKKEVLLKDDNTGTSGLSIFSFLGNSKWLKKLPRGIKLLFTGVFKLGKKVLIPLVTIGMDILKQLPITGRLIKGLTTLYHGFMSKLKNGLSKAKDLIVDNFDKLKTTTKTIWDKTKSKAASLWDTITSPFKKAWNWTKEKVSQATTFVKDKINKVWDTVSDAAKKVLGKFKAEADKLARWAKKFVPSEKDIKILLKIVKEKLPKWLIRKEGEKIAARFLASLGATLAGFVSGGLPGILMTLVDLYMWGDLAWEVYQFIKNEYFKEVDIEDKKAIFKFKSKKINFEDGSDFIDAVEDDEHASALFEHHWFSKNKVNFSTSNLYKFLKKGGSIQELENIYLNAKKYDRLENGSSDSKRVQALINLSKSGKLKNIKSEKQLEQLINEEIKKEQQHVQIQGKIQANAISREISNITNSDDLQKVVKHLQENNAISAQSSTVLANLLNNLNNLIHTLTQIESDSNIALKQLSIPDLSKV